MDSSRMRRLQIFLLYISSTFISAENCNVQSSSSSEYESFASGANDVLVVQQPDGELKATPFHVQVGKFSNWRTILRSRHGRLVNIVVNGNESPMKMTIGETGSACFSREKDRYVLRSDELKQFDLKKGANHGVFRVPSLKVEIQFVVYLLDQDAKLVVTDVDGTITEADFTGRVFPAFGIKANHAGVVRLFDEIAKNGYTVVYLTARSMGEDTDTKQYLFETLVNTDGGHSLPLGPVFQSPKSVAEAIVDAITGPNFQKTQTLESIVSLFTIDKDVVVAAYGNKETDDRAYRDAGISPAKIFIVDENNVLRNSADGISSSYGAQADKTDELFPKFNHA